MHNYSDSSLFQNSQISCSVVGARGYTGIETARLLLQHSHATLTHCFATSEFKLSAYLSNPKARQVHCLLDTEIMNNLTDVVFLATPAEASLKLAPKILAQGKKVIDLSGAFRLQKNDYKKWYGFDHNEPEYLSKAHYGLTAWTGPASTEKLVANPGCFATAILLALIPLLKNNLIKEDSVVIDAKSGASGAGKKAAENLLFSEVTGECLPYKVGRHQHYPEITEALEVFTGKVIDVHLTTSLLPVHRGLIAGVYAQLKPDITMAEVDDAFTKAYSQNILINYAALLKEPSFLSLKKVVGTAATNISYEVVGKRLYVFSCIDNLLKGAASQAVENFNRIYDLPIYTGLTHLEALL